MKPSRYENSEFYDELKGAVNRKELLVARISALKWELCVFLDHKITEARTLPYTEEEAMRNQKELYDLVDDYLGVSGDE